MIDGLRAFQQFFGQLQQFLFVYEACWFAQHLFYGITEVCGMDKELRRHFPDLEAMLRYTIAQVGKVLIEPGQELAGNLVLAE